MIQAKPQVNDMYTCHKTGALAQVLHIANNDDQEHVTYGPEVVVFRCSNETRVATMDSFLQRYYQH